MENNNEKLNHENEEKNNQLLKDTIEGLEKNLKELKSKMDIEGKGDKMEKIKDKAFSMKDSAVKEIKTRYDKADPRTQKMYIAGISAVIGAMITAIILKSPDCKHSYDDEK